MILCTKELSPIFQRPFIRGQLSKAMRSLISPFSFNRTPKYNNCLIHLLILLFNLYFACPTPKKQTFSLKPSISQAYQHHTFGIQSTSDTILQYPDHQLPGILTGTTNHLWACKSIQLTSRTWFSKGQ